jgi:hypothetical protein
MTLDEMEKRPPSAPRSAAAGGTRELLHVLMLPDLDRADRIGEFWAPGDEDELWTQAPCTSIIDRCC